MYLKGKRGGLCEEEGGWFMQRERGVVYVKGKRGGLCKGKDWWFM